jgi:hypothetical protein
VTCRDNECKSKKPIPQEEPQENPQGISLLLGGQLKVGGSDIRNGLRAWLF